MSGIPVFVGTRVPVQTLIDYLKDGSLDDFFEDFPSVTKEQAMLTLDLANSLLLERAHTP